jgi:hypothetical protein
MTNEQTRTIMRRLLIFIDEYKNCKISLRQLVSALEGSINALEENLPQEFYCLWYRHWGTLDTALALGVEIKNKKEILEELEELRKLVEKQV